MVTKVVLLRCAGTVTGTSDRLTLPENWDGVCDTCGLVVRVSGDRPYHTIQVELEERTAEASVEAGVAMYPPEIPS
jgi:hypothetical protein